MIIMRLYRIKNNNTINNNNNIHIDTAPYVIRFRCAGNRLSIRYMALRSYTHATAVTGETND